MTTLSGRLLQSATTLTEKKKKKDDLSYVLAKVVKMLVLLPLCLRVGCHSELGVLDLLNATGVVLGISEITPSSSVFRD